MFPIERPAHERSRSFQNLPRMPTHVTYFVYKLQGIKREI